MRDSSDHGSRALPALAARPVGRAGRRCRTGDPSRHRPRSGDASRVVRSRHARPVRDRRRPRSRDRSPLGLVGPDDRRPPCRTWCGGGPLLGRADGPSSARRWLADVGATRVGLAPRSHDRLAAHDGPTRPARRARRRGRRPRRSGAARRSPPTGVGRRAGGETARFAWPRGRPSRCERPTSSGRTSTGSPTHRVRTRPRAGRVGGRVHVPRSSPSKGFRSTSPKR